MNRIEDLRLSAVQVMTIKEVCEVTGMSYITIAKAIKAGLLRAVNLTDGKRKHITMDSLNAWLRGETQKGRE